MLITEHDKIKLPEADDIRNNMINAFKQKHLFLPENSDEFSMEDLYYYCLPNPKCSLSIINKNLPDNRFGDFANITNLNGYKSYNSMAFHYYAGYIKILARAIITILILLIPVHEL